MERGRTHSLPLIICFFFLCKTSTLCMGCMEEERQALLTFKQSLYDEYNVLSNWKGGNCCKWAGVRCSNSSGGHVIKLSIGSLISEYTFECSISSSNLNNSLSILKHLQYLDLRNTCFNNTPIPQFIGSLTTLKYLDLSFTDFVGTIPTNLGNLTSLRYLSFDSTNLLHTSSLQWLSHLSNLRYLDMSSVNLTDANDWPLVFQKIPSLSDLRLSSCGLHTFPDTLSAPHRNVSSVSTLDLSNNNFPDATKLDGLLLNLGNKLAHLDLSVGSMYGQIPNLLGNFSHLKNLSLFANQLNGPIPESLGRLSLLESLDLSMNSLDGFIPISIYNLCNLRSLILNENKFAGVQYSMGVSQPGCKTYSLKELDLSENQLSGSFPDWIKWFRYQLEDLELSSNQLTGELPDWIGEMRNLMQLGLYDNRMNGSIPKSVSKLSRLVEFDLGFNSFQGYVSDAHFANMTKLEALHLSHNHLVFNTSSTWVPPFKLKIIDLGSCQMGPRFPSWLQTQRNFNYLDISQAGISDGVPAWFWDASSAADYLNISNNQIRGETPTSLQFLNAQIIDLSLNLFQGKLPHFNSSVLVLYLHENQFSGDLKPVLNEAMSNLQILTLSRNLLTGKIPSAICNFEEMFVFDISYNNISGEVPRCDSNLSRLFSAINLASNHLHGQIPDWMCSSGGQLQLLRLENNQFDGGLPSSLRYCHTLIILDLGQNKLTGNIPSWLGENLSSLKFLRLRSNMLNGTIPPQLSNLTSLQLLDLAQNNLSGTIPRSFKKFAAMANMNKSLENVIDIHYHISFFFSGARSRSLFNMGLTGSLEEAVDVVVKGRQLEYTKTLSLVMLLDLSSNRLSGEIPFELMDLTGLQSLNLSRNHLTSKIPDKLGDMTELEALDLSENQLSGVIPSSITLLTSLSYLNLSYNNLSGRIPSGNQLQTITDTSTYVGNRDLCGSPLPDCPGDEPSEVPTPFVGTKDVRDSDKFDLYLSMGVGYVIGWWGICGIFVFKSSWRIAFFRFCDDMENRFFMAKEAVRRWIINKIQG